MRLIDGIVASPIKTSVGVLLLVLFGSISLVRMPMQLTPEVQTPTLTIETRWPGASPQEVEREIVQEQEEQLKAVTGVTKMTSESMDSMGRISLEFLVGTDMSEALLKVNTRLAQVREYPVDADEPVINTANSGDRPIAWLILGNRVPSLAELDAFIATHPELSEALQSTRSALGSGAVSGLTYRRLTGAAKQHAAIAEFLGPQHDIDKLQTLAEDIVEARYERVSGVANSNVIGGREEEMQVIVDPEKLAARNLTVADLRNALQQRNQDTSGGDFWEGKRRYVVRTLGQFRSTADVADVVVAHRAGQPVYVRDVAKIQFGYKKPESVVRYFGAPGIAINCQRENGANVIEVMDGIRAATSELNEDVLGPRGLQLEQVYDETEYIHSAVGLVQQNILLGGCLTIAVLLLFLRSARSTLVIGLAVPTSIIGTFLILGLLGRSLNVISLAGLAFAVGMLVDNAVVVLENIFRHYETGDPPLLAAVRGTQEVWGAVLASTLTTLAVFLPVLFVEEEAGQLFRDIALAISGAVGLSLILSVTLISTLSARILSSRRKPRAAPTQRKGLAAGFVNGVVALNAWLLRGTVRRLAMVVLLIGGAFGISYLLFPKVEYLPTGNRNLVFGILLPPPGYNLDQLLAMGLVIDAELKPFWDIDPADPQRHELEFPAISGFFYVARGRQVFMGLRTYDALRSGELVNLIRRVSMAIPGTFGVGKQASLFEQGLSAGRTVDIEISGPELKRLVQLGGQIMGQVMGVIPDAQAIPRPSLDLSSPEVHVLPGSEQTAEAGISARDLGYTVNALVDGAYATDFQKGGDKFDLSIIGQQRFASRTQDLRSLPIATPNGALVPLGALADIQLASGPEQINHRERQRTISIQVSPPPDIALEDAIERIESQIVGPLREGGQLAGGYRIQLSGTADKLRSTWQALQWNLLLAVLITYLLMAALFESWLYPLVIILSVPLGAVGGFAGLFLLNLFVPQPLDVLTMLGFVILIGTVVNNAILIVHQSLNHIRADNDSPEEAVLRSVRSRIRPIFMTTTTTVLGLCPLVLFPGAGSELYRGLGSVVLGGLVVSTLFTLVLVPTLFTLVLDAKRRLVGHGEQAAPVVAEA